MEAHGALIDARLIGTHSYRAGNLLYGCNLTDLCGGENHGTNEIHFHFECEREREQHERLRERE
jgi:hypothetical protein